MPTGPRDDVTCVGRTQIRGTEVGGVTGPRDVCDWSSRAGKSHPSIKLQVDL